MGSSAPPKLIDTNRVELTNKAITPQNEGSKWITKYKNNKETIPEIKPIKAAIGIDFSRIALLKQEQKFVLFQIEKEVLC